MRERETECERERDGERDRERQRDGERERIILRIINISYYSHIYL